MSADDILTQIEKILDEDPEIKKFLESAKSGDIYFVPNSGKYTEIIELNKHGIDLSKFKRYT